MDDYKTRLAGAIRAALFYAEMEPDDLARALNKHVESVRRWTRGETKIEVDEVVAVAAALNCPTDLFLNPPATREEALLQIAAYRGMRRGLAQ